MEWIGFVKSFGCNDYIAEDYVQEMYIKLHNNKNLMFNETEVNIYFIYVVLKNMYFDDLRKAVTKIELDDNYLQLEDEIFDDNYIEQSEAVKLWQLKLDSEISNIEKYNLNKSTLVYIKFIFDNIFIKNISITELSKQTNITYWSIRNTVQAIKNQIKNETWR